MDRKDQPKTYSLPPAEANPHNLYQRQAQTQNPNQYPNQYPAQTNYGFNQPPTQYSSVQPSPVVVHTVATVDNMYSVPPPDYTCFAWFVCLCCFWPTGIMAIRRAQESRDAVASGDMARAHSAAQSARFMVRVSYIVGIVSVACAVVAVNLFVIDSN